MADWVLNAHDDAPILLVANLVLNHLGFRITKYILRHENGILKKKSVRFCIAVKKLRTPLIYTPRDYIIAMQLARINPRPYNVEMLEYDFWQNGFQDSYVSSIRRPNIQIA